MTVKRSPIPSSSPVSMAPNKHKPLLSTVQTTTLSITVTAADDSVTEDTAADTTASGTVSISDTDTGEGSLVSSTATYGNVSVDSDGNWTYTLDNNQADVQGLNDGDTLIDTIIFTSDDGTTQTQEITINGTNDAATVSSADVELTETDAPLSTSGTLTATDVDNTDNAFVASTVVGTYGDFAIDASGAWTFDANAAFNELNVGDSYTETFNVTSEDGTASTVEITINGTNDAATVSSATVALTETDAPLSTSGTLTATDVDNTDNAFVASTVVGTYGDFAIDAAGAWTFDANAAFNELNVGDSYTETFNVTSEDGTASTVEITINGTNDAATVSSATVALTETDAPLSTSGTLTATDVDNTDNAFVASSSCWHVW